MFKKTSKFWDIISEILAVIFILAFAFLIINATFGWVQDPTVLKIFTYIRDYGALLIAGVVGLEAISKRNVVIQIIFVAIMAIIVIFLFFPGTYQNLIGLIPTGNTGK
jgi:hypothetical protein